MDDLLAHALPLTRLHASILVNASHTFVLASSGSDRVLSVTPGFDCGLRLCGARGGSHTKGRAARTPGPLPDSCPCSPGPGSQSVVFGSRIGMRCSSVRALSANGNRKEMAPFAKLSSAESRPLALSLGFFAVTVRRCCALAAAAAASRLLGLSGTHRFLGVHRAWKVNPRAEVSGSSPHKPENTHKQEQEAP